jgi:hypothetical protein
MQPVPISAAARRSTVGLILYRALPVTLLRSTLMIGRRWGRCRATSGAGGSHRPPTEAEPQTSTSHAPALPPWLLDLLHRLARS